MTVFSSPGQFSNHSPGASGHRSARFDRFTDYVQKEIGVKLDASKRSMVETRLRRRMNAIGFSDFEGYLAHLFEGKGLEDEREAIINAVTTNKTDFYREAAHFDHMTEHAIPAAVLRARAGRRLVKVWSAAASTGAEAWTAAFCLAEYALRHGDFQWGVIGTDINSDVLETAERAIYDRAFVAPVPRQVRARWLRTGSGDFSGHYRVVPALRKRVRFVQANLLAPNFRLDHGIDVIFLRNVLIYFSPEDQTRVIRRMADHLAPGGILYLGHSESMSMNDNRLKTLGPSIFERIA